MTSSTATPRPPEVLTADPDVAEYALRLGDDALVLAQRLCAAITTAPELEEDVALANIGLDLLGHARILLDHAGRLEGAGRDEDALAFLRTEREYRNCLLVEQENGDFAHIIVRQLVASSWQEPLYEALTHSTDATLAALAARAVREVAYHREHAALWTVRLGDGTALSHARMEAALADLWPFTTELAERDALVDRLVERGVAADPDAVATTWRASLAAVLAEATLEAPEPEWHPTGGRRGLHGEEFGRLLAEMQALPRQFPGARW